jgi:uncharacterized SAM-dependent methyltransferase
MSKVRLLRPTCSSPIGIDIAKAQLITAAETLAYEYPWLEVFAVCADFGVELPGNCRCRRAPPRGVLSRVDHRQLRTR